MPEPRLVCNLSAVEKLNTAHDVKRFRCGKHSLDQFIRRHALKNQQADSSQTYVVHRDGSVVGYYTLTAGCVEREECAPDIVAPMPPYHPVPVILLARLAIDRSEQGHGLGSALLKDALYRVASAAGLIGARALLVHALDADARAFYEHFGFEEFPAGSLHLMLAMSQIRAAIGLAT